MLTINLDAIALMSCNPSIGGLAKAIWSRRSTPWAVKWQKNIDATGIQFRILNTRKGPAVRASRAQADKQLYRLRMKSVMELQPNLNLMQGEVTALYMESDELKGVDTRAGIRYWGDSCFDHWNLYEGSYSYRT
jgi:tRNA uridine 5-carboxymethylaminomethyl modification enzyme